jgi:geranylgeranyl diphosphate synthase type I
MEMNDQTTPYLKAIEEELKHAVLRSESPHLGHYDEMMAYHMGWEGEGSGAKARGKRIRPLLVLLCNDSAGGDWQAALPAAAAVELVHNFSLIHDDIQDESPTRRGRTTVWKKWGIAQAINTGDAMLTLAHLWLLRLERLTSPEITLRAVEILQNACLLLTQGQYLDLAYESHASLPMEAYWHMVAGKTAALLAACTEIGAVTARADKTCCQVYHQFGHSLGLAFQAQDDILGIWGDAALTGKSTASDLLAGKKSLPIVYGLSQGGPFARRWAEGAIQPAEIDALASQLKAEGAFQFTQEKATELTNQALEYLEEANPQGEAGQALILLAHQLLSRRV